MSRPSQLSKRSSSISLKKPKPKPPHSEWIVGRPIAWWNHFFHRQADLSMLGPIRIGYALLMLINVLMWWPDLEKWFGENGVLTLERSRLVIDSDSITIFQWLPTTPFVLWACYLTLIVSLVLLLVGLFSRLQLVIVFVLFTSFVHRNIMIMDGEDTLFRIMAFLLFLTPCGSYCSISRWWKLRGEGEEGKPAERKLFPIWSLRLIQLQVSGILIFSGIEKLQGKDWLAGTAMFYVSRLDDLFYRFPVPDFMFNSMTMLAILTWATLVVELCLPLAVWIPKTRRLALVVVLLFHLSLDYAMNLNLFQWIMLVAWMSFVSPDDVRAVRGWFGRFLGGSGGPKK